MFASGADRLVLINAAVLDRDAERSSDCCCTSRDDRTYTLGSTICAIAENAVSWSNGRQIAHDFKNLLTVMIGFRDLLFQLYRSGEQPPADVMQIKQNANRVVR